MIIPIRIFPLVGLTLIFMGALLSASETLTDQTKVSKEIFITKPYLVVPVERRGQTDRRWMQFYVDDQRVRDFDIHVAMGAPEWWMPVDVREFIGKELTIIYPDLGEGFDLKSIRVSDEFPAPDSLYRETYRPQFHFTTRMGRLNDPNGLVYHKGEYHLFFQHTPYSVEPGAKHWGHAVSRDLVHWEELPTALFPDELGHIFSGSSVIDCQNTSGFQDGDEPVMVAIYTSAPGVSGHSWSRGRSRTQSIAFSNDRGRTFTKYEGNPVVDHIRGNNRDPKVFWHEPTQKWIMFLYLQRPRFAFLSSPDLKNWTFESELEIPDGHECPDIFALPVDGNTSDIRWVVWEASGRYLIGDFDGKVFTSTDGPYQALHGSNDYASQTFNNMPHGRVVQIAWLGRGGCRFPNMPFNQQMGLPRELSLGQTEGGVRLLMNPIPELETLRSKHHEWSDIPLVGIMGPLEGLQSELLEIELIISPGSSKAVGLDVFGLRVNFAVEQEELEVLGKATRLNLLNDGTIKLRLFVDRTSMEIFANSGIIQKTFCYNAFSLEDGIKIFSEDGRALINSFNIWELSSIWD